MKGYVKRIGNEIKETWKEDKSTLIVYFTLRALVILCMVLQILRGDLQNILLCVLTLILLLIPFFVEKYMKIDMPNVLEIITMLFVFSAEILGEINNFYGMIVLPQDAIHALFKIWFRIIYRNNNTYQFFFHIYLLSTFAHES